MKRFLKPTGRILTTAVFTSAAFETLIPDTAVPTPIPDPLPPDHAWRVAGDESAPEKATTVIPPEALSRQEFTPSSLSGNSLPDIDLTPYRAELSFRIDEPTEPWEADLTHTTPTLPAFQLTMNAVDDDDEFTELMSHLGGDRDQTRPESQLFEQRENDEIAAQTRSSQQSRNAPSLPDSFEFNIASGASSAPSLPHTDADSNTAGPTTTPPRNDEPMTIEPSLDSHSSSNHADEEVIEATREWLDETLSQIVMRDRTSRESQLRENLMLSAQDYITQGKLEPVQRIVENPALSDTERDELRSAIAEAEASNGSSATYPFVSAQQARFMTRQSIRHQPLPHRDWLLSHMDRVAAALNPSCDINGRSLSSTDPQRSQFNSQPSPQHTAFLSGGAFLAGVGHQPPSASNKSGLPPGTPHQQIARRQDDCTPTIGQNIGGLTVATLSGYQWLNQSSPHRGGGLQMVMPLAVPANITSHFGWRTHPIYGGRRFHFGIDFGAPSGTPILAALPGRVETSHYLDGYGLTVILENQDLNQRTLYAHMSGIAVQPGTWIEQGDVIGWVGSTGNSTGPHLHFEVHQRQGNDWVAVDPLQAATQLIANRQNTRLR
jgi:murein DD-endopeptidase MepM/ murein hydrolase activator NlpD